MQARVRPARDPVGRLHRPGDRLDGTDRDRGPGARGSSTRRRCSLGPRPAARSGWRPDDGLTKLLFEPGAARLLGAGIVGVSAGELIAETVHALEMGADAEDIGLTIHPHPTLSETVMFAAEMAAGTITDLHAAGGGRQVSSAQVADELLRLVLDPALGDAEHAVAGELELRVPRAILLELLRGTCGTRSRRARRPARSWPADVDASRPSTSTFACGSGRSASLISARKRRSSSDLSHRRRAAISSRIASSGLQAARPGVRV